MQTLISILVAFTVFFSSFGVSLGCGDKKGSLPEDRKQTIRENYEEFISEVEGNENRIPMIVSTDQHGAVTAGCDLYKYVDSIVDWDKISRIINIGDTVSDDFNISELINYKAATRFLPAEKRVECVGNHDRRGNVTSAGLYISNLFFSTPVCEKSPDGRAFTATDEQFGVRYLGVDTNNSPWSYTSSTLSTSLADYIVEELSKTDDTDIVLVSHSYLFRDAMIRRDGSVFTGSENFIGDGTEYADVKQSFVDMLNARKNKTSGILIDCEGAGHAYDFSACEGDFLMTLHGHHHTEGYETKDGITEFLFQGMTKDNEQNAEPFCFYFCYIDTAAKTFKCWKNIEGYDAWEISIA